MSKKTKFFEARQNVQLQERLRIEKALREDAEARLEAARTPPPAPVAAAPAAPPPPPPTLKEQVAAYGSKEDIASQISARLLVLANMREYAAGGDEQMARYLRGAK